MRKEVGITEAGEADYDTLKMDVVEFAREFGYDAHKILKQNFTKLYPRWLRPYGRLYAY